jgi:hypothetical protein
LRDVPYCTVKAISGTVTYCAVSRLFESGLVSYCNGLERIGTVTTNSDIWNLLTVGSESSSDLLTAIGNFELILCSYRIMIDYFVLLFSYNQMKSGMHANVRQFENPYQ